jgi:hypothetical protein
MIMQQPSQLPKDILYETINPILPCASAIDEGFFLHFVTIMRKIKENLVSS